MATVKTLIGNIKGGKGDAGKSAYQYALDGGYTGTEDEFMAKMAAELNTKVFTFTHDDDTTETIEVYVK